MNRYSTLAKATIVGVFGVVGWAICGAIMAIGPMYMPMDTTLIVHAIGGPAAFAALSAIYFNRFGFTTPLQTAFIFLGIVIGLDVVLVAPVFVGDFSMFQSLIGTWIPFALIFAATYVTGLALPGSGTRMRAV